MATVARPVPGVRPPLATRATALAGVAVALAALSLIAPYALAFDPLAWLVWGRDVGRLALDTSTGPSWKPLPVVVTTPLAALGDAAPALWLVVARAGALLGLAGAFTLAAGLAGRWAGVGAAAVMALSPWWAYNSALGNSEGLLAAAVTWAAVAFLAGRHRAALALAVAASLLRPEAWVFLAVYGVWLWRHRPGDRGAVPPDAGGEPAPPGWWSRGRGAAPADAGGSSAGPWRGDRCAVLLAGALVLALWFGPGLVGAGGALSASRSARGIPSPGSAKLADVPAFALLGDTATLLTLPALLAALAGVALGGRAARGLAAGAAAWVAVVVAMTTAGYAGNPRYLVAATALGAPLAGVGAVRAASAAARLLRPAPPPAERAAAASPVAGGGPPLGAAGALGVAVPPRAPAAPARRLGRAAPAGAAALVAAVLLVTAGDLRGQARELGERADAAAAFDGVIARAGGRGALLRCAPIRTSNRARTLVAWRLDLPLRDLDARPAPPAVVIRAKWFYGQGLEPRLDPGYRILVTAPYWQVAAACAA